VIQLYLYGLGLLAKHKNDQALEVAQVNARHHPDEKFWTRLGLARAYTALNDRARAIENWEVALRNVPLSEQTDVPSFEASLEKLKSGH
jgi:tetratricopeptide (TPR) repeat protein